MDISVWGNRGSFICPEKEFLKYGGNTTCLEINGVNNNRILVDAGSGLIKFGQNYLSKPHSSPLVFHILLTHTHIDHIQGFSFFAPIHFPDTRVKIYCSDDGIQNVEDTFHKIFHTNYSPIQKIDNLQACIKFIRMRENEPMIINGFQVTPLLVDHPTPTFAYKITDTNDPSGKNFGFITDHEMRNNEINKNLIGFFKDTDLIFHDGEYTTEDYISRIGWGHSSIENAVNNGVNIGCKKLGICHHSPDYNDDMLSSLENQYKNTASDCEIFWVKESTTINL